MPLLFIYLFKLSVSLAIMYLFYQFVLRRLTFYNHNRGYLLGYSLICFFIPLINISPVLGKNAVVNSGIVAIVPAFETITAKVSPNAAIGEALGGFTIWSWVTTIVILGAIILLVRLIIQYFSFRKIKNEAKLVADEEIRFYQVDKNIIPFSFGNSIFLNQRLHTEAELKEIIRHEFVHVKQHHTLDIIWTEVLCILNWYNPFAWLIKKAIRQNLEFIADNKVVENGMEKKQYQYLLLKVIGNSHFSIASNFNFSSLKKRIVMMNKIRSAKVHLIKFLFVLPLLAIVLLSFRSSYPGSKNKPVISNASMVIDLETKQPLPGVKIVSTNTGLQAITDTVPTQITQNDKGYYIDIKDNKGNCIVVVKDKDKKEIKRLLLTEWNKKEKYYEKLYGEILVHPPSPAAPAAEAIPTTQAIQPAQPAQPSQSAQPAQPSQPSQVAPAKPTVNLKNIVYGYDSNKPLIIVDGVEWPGGVDVNILDANKIEEVSVWKNGSAANKYGEKGKNGVLFITTKKQADANPQTGELRTKKIPGNVLYYLNGKQITKEVVDLLDPDKIKSIDVLKGDKAKEKYGEKGKNGIIEITIPVSSRINFIEKPITPAWDIKNVLPGKKKDEC